MSEINIDNKDWSIVAAVKNALSGAAVGGSAAFSAVVVSTSDVQIGQCQLKTHPLAIIRYISTAENESPGGHFGCTLSLELIVVTKICLAGTDESSWLEEVLRLVNAAKNAVNAAKPPDSCAWADDDNVVRRIEFGAVKIDTAQDQLWATARLPLAVGYTLDTDTSH